jgi:hypothetical protein
MSMFENRPNSALLIDMQNGVIWVQHSDGQLARLSATPTGDHTAWGAPPPDQVIAHTNLYRRSSACERRR